MPGISSCSAACSLTPTVSRCSGRCRWEPMERGRMHMVKSIELTENQKAWNRLVTIMVIWERARNLELAKIGLNLVQAEVLYCLKTSDEPVTPMRLARMMHK